MSETTNHKLFVTNDSSTTFQTFREKLVGETDSNMTKIDTALAAIDKTLIDVEQRVSKVEDTPTNGVLYGVCDTEASDREKTVNIDDFPAPMEGCSVRVKFTNGMVASGPTLNVSDTGDIAITLNGQIVQAENTSWPPESVIDFAFDGENWNIVSTVLEPFERVIEHGDARELDYGDTFELPTSITHRIRDGKQQLVTTTSTAKLPALPALQDMSGWLPVRLGGTGAITLTQNAVLIGNEGKPVQSVATRSGAFFAIADGETPKFGTLPIALGGTGATTAANARAKFEVYSYSEVDELIADNKPDLSAYPTKTDLTATLNGYPSNDDMNTAISNAVTGKADKSTNVTETLTISGWSADKTQTVTIEGLSADTNGMIGLAPGASAEEREACRNAMFEVQSIGTDTITIIADGDIPTVDIPITVIIV